MALIVEDGTIVANADSYVSVTDADAYHTARGNSVWSSANTTDKEVALREATAYLDATYKRQWQGQRRKSDQSLDWPRYDIHWPDGYHFDSDKIPQDLKDAVCELALRALSTDLDPDLSRGGRVKSQSVGPLSQTFFDDAPAGTTYQRVENLIAWLIGRQAEAQVKLERG